MPPLNSSGASLQVQFMKCLLCFHSPVLLSVSEKEGKGERMEGGEGSGERKRTRKERASNLRRGNTKNSL